MRVALVFHAMKGNRTRECLIVVKAAAVAAVVVGGIVALLNPLQEPGVRSE